jgi:hypothetical protein
MTFLRLLQRVVLIRLCLYFLLFSILAYLSEVSLPSANTMLLFLFSKNETALQQIITV